MVRIVIFISFIIFLTSCSVTKRVHRKGFHIEWHKQYRSEKKIVENEISTKNDKIAEFMNAEQIGNDILPISLPQTKTKKEVNSEKSVHTSARVTNVIKSAQTNFSEEHLTRSSLNNSKSVSKGSVSKFAPTFHSWQEILFYLGMLLGITILGALLKWLYELIDYWFFLIIFVLLVIAVVIIIAIIGPGYLIGVSAFFVVFLSLLAIVALIGFFKGLLSDIGLI